MVRVQDEFGAPTSHIENRISEPGANLYLYSSTSMWMYLPLTEPSLAKFGHRNFQSPTKTLMEALSAFKQDTLFRHKMGGSFIDLILKMKESETFRFLASLKDKPPQEYLEQVTDWEHREYFCCSRNYLPSSQRIVVPAVFLHLVSNISGKGGMWGKINAIVSSAQRVCMEYVDERDCLHFSA